MRCERRFQAILTNTQGIFFFLSTPFPPLVFRIIFQEHICKSSKGNRTVSTRGWYTVFPLCTVEKIDKRNKE